VREAASLPVAELIGTLRSAGWCWGALPTLFRPSHSETYGPSRPAFRVVTEAPSGSDRSQEHRLSVRTDARGTVVGGWWGKAPGFVDHIARSRDGVEEETSVASRGCEDRSRSSRARGSDEGCSSERMIRGGLRRSASSEPSALGRPPLCGVRACTRPVGGRKTIGWMSAGIGIRGYVRGSWQAAEVVGRRRPQELTRQTPWRASEASSEGGTTVRWPIPSSERKSRVEAHRGRSRSESDALPGEGSSAMEGAPDRGSVWPSRARVKPV